MNTKQTFNVSYDDIVKFIEELDQEKREKLINLLVSKGFVASTDSVSQEELIDFATNYLTDQELYSLGFPEDITPSQDEAYDEVVSLLSNTDSNIKETLYAKYNTNNDEILANNISDEDLIALQVPDESVIVDEKPPKVIDVLMSEKTDDFFDDETFDYLEDIPSDIDYAIIDKDKHIYYVPSLLEFEKFKDALDPVLVEDCTACDAETYDYVNNLGINTEEQLLGTEGVLFNVNPVTFEEYDEQISEEVVINDTLNSEIFTDSHKMKSVVLQQLLDYVGSFIEYLQNKSIDVDYSDIQLIGSNAGYLYSPESDIDIHIIWSYPLFKDAFEQLQQEIKMFKLDNTLNIGDYPVEINVEDGQNMQSSSKRRYSLIEDDWVDNSDEEEEYKQDDINLVSGYEDIVTDYANKIDNVVDNDLYSDALALKTEIRKNRSDDLANEGSLSMGNVVFKELRNNGAYGKLRTYIKDKEVELSNNE